MTAGSHADARSWSLGALKAGAALGALDALVAMGPLGERLPNAFERAAFAIALVGLVGLSAWVASALMIEAARLVGRLPLTIQALVVQTLAAIVGITAGIGIFSGTAVRRSSLRPVAIVATVLIVIAVVRVAWTRRVRIGQLIALHPSLTRLALIVASGSFYLFHAFVLVRLYPVIHAFAAAFSLILLALALGIGTRPRGRNSYVTAVALAVLFGVIGAVVILRSQMRRSLTRQRAPLAGYVVQALGSLLRRETPATVLTRAAVIHGMDLDFRDRDLVLVTVDALRADRIGAYGGPAGITPVLDAMAARGVVIEHAYCTTPHTSYSIASLMTGKFFRELSALGAPRHAHATLAGTLASRGYATIALFPPAIFNVDGERLGDLRVRSFDFSEHRIAYDDANTRVAAVDEFLGRNPSNHRVFVWVHFFEPHEPYDAHPDARYHTDTSTASGRYDGEVAATDDAIGRLRTVFDRHQRRPVWIVVADHGEEFGEHGGRFHGTTVYEEQVRVPWIIEGPGVPTVRSSGPASLVDLMPTVLAAMGIERSPRLRGRDLGPMIYGHEWDAPIYASAGTMRLLADHDDRLICDVSEGSCEFYDLRSDPLERRNSVDERASRVAILQPLLRGWEASHGALDRDDARNEIPDPPALERALQGDRSAADELAATLGTLHGPAAVRAARALADLNVRSTTVIEALHSALGSDDSHVASEAGVSLALLSDPRGMYAAQRALHASDLSLSRRAALGLARLGFRDGLDVLAASAIDTNNDAARDAAVDALTHLNDPRAFDTWITLLADPRLAPRAADALAALHDPRAIGALSDVARTTRYVLTRRAALDALAVLHAPEALELLIGALAKPDELPDPFPIAARLGEPGHQIAGRNSPISLPSGTREIEISVNAPNGRSWIFARFQSPQPTDIELAGTAVHVTAGDSTIRVPSFGALRRIVVRTRQPVVVVAIAVVASDL